MAGKNTAKGRVLGLGLLGLAAFGLTFLTVKFVESRKEGPRADGPPGMVWIPAGEFTMGSEWPDARPDERPAHRVQVDGFWIDASEVTNAQFREFVEATRYVSTAERAPELQEIMRQLPSGTPRPAPEDLVPGALVFVPSKHHVTLDDIRQWWKWTRGADWRHPDGPDSSITGLENHPAVQVSWDDAVAYAAWAGKRLRGAAAVPRWLRADHPRQRGVRRSGVPRRLRPASRRTLVAV